jgi:carbon monoxide dehydrogenase subunit G
MDITGRYRFKLPQETVWKLLMNPDVIAKAIPGVDHIDPIAGEPDAWRAVARIGIATVSGTYTGTIRMSEIEAPDRYRLTVNGEGKQSFIKASALFNLSYDPATQRTLVTWTAETNISGKLASVGQRLIAGAALLLSKLFFRALARQVPDYSDVEEEEGGEEELATS